MLVAICAAARKTKQVKKLLNLLESKKRSLIDILMSLAYLVGEPVDREKKERKTKIIFQNLIHHHHQV